MERESDLREQLKFTEEESRIMRKKLRQSLTDDDDEITESRRSSLRSVKDAPPGPAAVDRQLSEVDKDDSEIRMQLDSAEQEVRRCFGCWWQVRLHYTTDL